MTNTNKKHHPASHPPRDLASFLDRIQQRFKDATITPDLAETPTGTSYIDILSDGHNVSVQWKEGLGFGISSPPESHYGEGADEVYDSGDAAFARIESLILGRKHTSRRSNCNS